MEPGGTDAKPERPGEPQRPGEPPPEAERTVRMDGRLSGRGRPEDVTKAKREIALAFDLADEFAKKTVAGSPMWDYMAAQWPYGYPDRALPDIFHRGLTLAFVPPSWKKKAYCPIWTTLKRLGFHPDDEEHVYGTLEIAFFAILALELRTSGGRCLSKDIKFVKDQHRIAFKEIISLNAVIRQWMEPGEQWFERLREPMLRNAQTRIEVVGAQIQLARDNDSTAAGQMHMTVKERRKLGVERMRIWAEAQHTSMVGYGVQAVLQQLWAKAEATWLSRARQYLGSDRSQWKEVRMRCDDERHGFWLPTYDQAMLQPPDVIVDEAKTYLRRYLERRAASLSQGRGDSEMCRSGWSPMRVVKRGGHNGGTSGNAEAGSALGKHALSVLAGRGVGSERAKHCSLRWAVHPASALPDSTRAGPFFFLGRGDEERQSQLASRPPRARLHCVSNAAARQKLSSSSLLPGSARLASTANRCARLLRILVLPSASIDLTLPPSLHLDHPPQLPLPSMVLSLVIDDTSLVLILVLVAALAVSIYVSRSYQPLIHPLILTRQADVSQTRQPNESAIYRNANSPAGFDLALRPRKEINDIADLIKHGANGSERNAQRAIYGTAKSNQQVAADATSFATGFIKLSSAPVPQTVLAVAAESDDYESIVALLSNAHTSVSSRYNTVVLPPNQLESQSPTSLPHSLASKGARSAIGVYTTAKSIRAVLQLPFLDSSALIIVPDADLQEATRIVSDHFGASHRLRLYAYDAVLAAGSPGSLLGPDTSSRDVIEHTQSHYWAATSSDWLDVRHSHLVAGVTSNLAAFPADKIPNTNDHIFVEACAGLDSPASELMATRTPLGFALALTALYTGAAITADLPTSSYDDPNPAASAAFAHAQPTLVYATAEGASSLACALTSCTRRSPLASWAATNKLFTLRNGSFARNSFADTLVYNGARTTVGCSRVRTLLIAGRGDTVPQALLDSLRAHLGCAVLNAYVPKLKTAAVTAPVSVTHAFDLQAFAEHETAGMQVPAHVGPPSVAAEVKLLQTRIASDAGLAIAGDKPAGQAGDPMGEVHVRGNVVAHLSQAGAVDSDTWSATGDLAAFRSNGTLVVLRDSDNADVVGVPTLSSRKPVRRQRRTATAGAKTVLAAALVLAVSLSPTASAGVLHKRGSSVNNTMSDMAKMGMLAGQRASWEQGVSQAALLELDYPGWSVFSSSSGGPPYRPGLNRGASGPPNEVIGMAYHSASRQDSLGRLAFRITGDEQLGTGSSLDGASPGPEVLLAAWLDGEIDRQTGAMGRGFYADSSRATLDMVLRRTPRSRAGAISHRSQYVALWSDAMYMMPPYLAFYGLVTRNNTLLQLAYDQIRLYRDGMRLTSGASTNLWGHIYLPDNRTWTDGGAWATGNGWVLAGMARTLATIEQSQASQTMASQKNDLVSWMNEILDAAYPLLDERALLFHNYMNDTTTFFDTAGTALIAYATYRLASLAPGNDRWIGQADVIYRSLATALNPIGQFRDGYPVADVLAFVRQGDTSSESLAFMMLMNAAKRDYANNDVVKITDAQGKSNTAAPVLAPKVVAAAIVPLLVMVCTLV